jgi:hypothetical protein
LQELGQVDLHNELLDKELLLSQLREMIGHLFYSLNVFGLYVFIQEILAFLA